MTLDIDHEAGCAYIYFREGLEIKGTSSLAPDVNVDVGPDHEIIGIELLSLDILKDYIENPSLTELDRALGALDEKIRGE